MSSMQADIVIGLLAIIALDSVMDHWKQFRNWMDNQKIKRSMR